MLSDEERWEKRRWRWQWIARFAERQRAARQWIAFPEIAEWCARSVTGASVPAEEQARTLAYQRLDQSSRDGEFEGVRFCQGRAISATRSKILYLDPLVTGDGASPRCRLRREQLDYVAGIRDVAPYCWVPRGLARQWLAAHGYSWPTHFDPVAATFPAMSPADIALEPAEAAAPLHGKALDDALDQWARAMWGSDMRGLPNRDQLLSLARTAKPEFRSVSQQDVRALRRRLAPAEIRKGGASTHR